MPPALALTRQDYTNDNNRYKRCQTTGATDLRQPPLACMHSNPPRLSTSGTPSTDTDGNIDSPCLPWLLGMYRTPIRPCHPIGELTTNIPNLMASHSCKSC